MRVIRSAQFELSVDGVPRSYRDRKDLALQSAQILKSRNPNSVVKLKDLQTGEEIVIAFKSGHQVRFRHQRPDHARARRRSAAHAAHPRRRGDRMKRREFITVLGGAAVPF